LRSDIEFKQDSLAAGLDTWGAFIYLLCVWNE